jgi:hypothetical protein
MGKIKEMTISDDDQMVISIAEANIRKSPEMYKKLSTSNILEDFADGEIVRCTFLKSLFEVVGPSLFNSNKLYVSRVGYIGDEVLLEISPDFLKKVEANKKTMKVLYGN